MLNFNLGYTGRGFSCMDLDECVDTKGQPNTKTCENLACSNTEGSYECSCLKGYQGTPGNCTDIDECQSYGLNS